MPVVWCTDPNSVNSQPTAFALHGIQLQGNVTEKQVMALRELVNAAAEGRLILPSDGTFVLLDSGISIESSILGSAGKKENSKDLNHKDCDKENSAALNKSEDKQKNTYILMPVTPSHANSKCSNEHAVNSNNNSCSAIMQNEAEKALKFNAPNNEEQADENILYEFLCCAKCMNEMYAARERSTTSSPSSPVSISSNAHRARYLSCSSVGSISNCPYAAQPELRDARHQSSILQRYLKTCSNRILSENQRNNNFKVNELPQNNPLYAVASKYTQKYHRKHCNVLARKRQHYHKLPMQSVKIFHNRNTPSAGSNSNSLATTPTTTTAVLNKTEQSLGEQKSNSNLLTVVKANPLPLYATVNKNSNNSKLAQSSIKDIERGRHVSVMSAVPSPYTMLANNQQNKCHCNASANASSACPPIINSNEQKPSSRQRKFGAVTGGLQDSLHSARILINSKAYEFEELALQVKPSTSQVETAIKNCDDNSDRDLITFEEIANNSQNCDNLANCQTAADTLDLLCQPNPETVEAELPLAQARSNNSSRKTSFDSTCTISSMDSGFMDMQNKLDNSGQTNNASPDANAPNSLEQLFSNACSNNRECSSNEGGEKIARLNYKECLTQSRNRRKSYEEFKALHAAAAQVLAANNSNSQVMRKNQNLKCSKVKQEMKENENSNESTPGLTVEQQQQTTPTSLIAVDALDFLGNLGVNLQSKPDCQSNQLESTTTTITTSSEMDISIPAVAGNSSSSSTLKQTTCAVNTSLDQALTTTEILRKNSDYLAKILDNKLTMNGKEKEKAHIRRKSYEEFKRLVKEAAGAEELSETTQSPFKRQNSRQRKSLNAFMQMRRSLSKQETASNAIDLVVMQNSLSLPPLGSSNGANSSKNSAYKRNFKIYDKLVYGTIYDIIQRKNDIYNLTYQKYDKYMTYGTIYEILHRKSSQTCTAAGAELFQRKSLSAIMEKEKEKEKDDKNCKATKEKLTKTAGNKSELIYDIIQKQQQQQQQQQKNLTVQSLKESTTRKYGTIYDILQGEKLDSIETASGLQQKGKNRFKVSKIDETDAKIKSKNENTSEINTETTAAAVSNSSENLNKTTEYCEPSKATAKAMKPNKMRRLSNILSYKVNTSALPKLTKTQESSAEEQKKESPTANEKYKIPSCNLIPFDSEELYSRIVAQHRALVHNNNHKSYSQQTSPNAIVKSNSLDAISSSVALTPPATPSPPRPRRSLKQQHHCPLHGNTKKLSLDHTSVSNKSEDLPQRRWSANQMLPSSITTIATTKCKCAESSNILAATEKCCSTLLANCSEQLNNKCDQCLLCVKCFNTHHSCTTNCNSNETTTTATTANTLAVKSNKKGKSRRLSEFTRGEFLNEKL